MITCVKIKDVGYYEKVSGECRRERTSYYAGEEAEADGEGVWMMLGDGLCDIEDGSEVEFAVLEQLAAGCDPRTKRPLVISTRTERISGFDLQFPPPKGISVSWAFADADTRARIEQCGARAVRDTLQFVHAEGLLECRRGKGGITREAAAGWAAAVFRHGLSRAGDPQLHWHAVVPNAALRLDKTTGGLDNKAALSFARAVGARFNAVYAEELRHELGWSCRRSDDGKSFDLLGLDDKHGHAVCQQFSKRRAEVVAVVQQSGVTTAEAPQAARLAALNTREAKADLPSLRELETRWADELAALDTTPSALIETIIERSRSIEGKKAARLPEQAARSVVRAALATLTERDGVFEHRHLLQEVFEVAQGVVGPVEITAAQAESEAGGRIVALGRDDTGRPVYSTPQYIKIIVDAFKQSFVFILQTSDRKLFCNYINNTTHAKVRCCKYAN